MSRTLTLAAGLALALPLAASAACPGFKSGTYVALNALEADLAWRVNMVSIDATTLQVTDREGTIQLTADATENCKYYTPNGNPLMVNRSGVFGVRIAGEGTSPASIVLGLPLKKVPLNQLTGTWNYLRHARESDGYLHTSNGQLNFGARGVLDVGHCDATGINCITPKRLGKITADANGGFLLTERDGSLSRFFALKAADGTLMLAGVSMDQSTEAMVIATPKLARSLPAVGDAYEAWDMNINRTGVVSAVSAARYRITAVDAATNSFKRKNLDNCSVQTFQVNSGSDGWTYRPAGTTTTGCGTTKTPSTYNSLLSMNLRAAFGFAAYGWESTVESEPRFFGLSISK